MPIGSHAHPTLFGDDVRIFSPLGHFEQISHDKFLKIKLRGYEC